MHCHYEVKPSKTQATLLAGSYALAAITWCLALETGMIQFAGVALCALLGLRESSGMLCASPYRLRIDRDRRGIVYEAAGQTYFYAKYKVYPSRWFAILKLIDETNSMTLILRPDSFNRLADYQNLRYELGAAEMRRVA